MAIVSAKSTVSRVVALCPGHETEFVYNIYYWLKRKNCQTLSLIINCVNNSAFRPEIKLSVWWSFNACLSDVKTSSPWVIQSKFCGWTRGIQRVSVYNRCLGLGMMEEACSLTLTLYKGNSTPLACILTDNPNRKAIYNGVSVSMYIRPVTQALVPSPWVEQLNKCEKKTTAKLK